MTTLTDDSLAVVALTNRLVDSGAAPLKASELWRLLAHVNHPSTLVGLGDAAIADVITGTELDSERVARLLDTGIGLAVRVDGLFERGISVLTAADERYPARLRDRLQSAAPPVLYYAGDVALLASDGVGIVGSRDIGSEATDVTVEAARFVAHNGFGLVSGGAKGVDSIAMSAAFEAGGTAVGVLADSLERAIGRRDNRAAVLDGRALLCTPYRPDAGFSAGNAMGRNKIIYALSRVTLVVASAEGEGGTWSGATEALKRRFGRVAVWTGPGCGLGNAALVKAGGTPIDKPEQILDVSADLPPANGDQMALTFGSTVKPVDASPVDASQPRTGIGTGGEGDPVADADAAVGDVVAAAPPQAVLPKPTGTCWCGCGQETKPGAFFVARHAPGAAQRAVIKHFGSVEAFLLMLGEAPGDAGRGSIGE